MQNTRSYPVTSFFQKIVLIAIIFISSGQLHKLAAQSIGDYKSNIASGGISSWTSLATWLRWNGNAWAVPAAAPSGPGWPGQKSGTGTVLIQANQTVTVNNLTTVAMGTVTVNGILSLSGINSNLINTSKLIINNYLNGSFTTASIYFDGKAFLRLPAGAIIVATIINQNTDPEWLQGSCNNNDEVLIGTVTYAVCAGQGNDHPLFSFTDVMINGGTLKPLAKILPDPAITCPGTALEFDGNPSSTAGTLTHTWSGTGAAFLNFTNIQKPVFTCNIAGSYNLKYSVTDGVYSAIDDITVIVSDQFTRWTGNANTSDWNNVTNWTCGVPASTADVIIADVSPKPQPVVNSANATCHDLTIYNSGILNIEAGEALTVNGDLVNNGTILIKSSGLNSNGSLIVNGTSEGSVTYDRNITPGKWFITSAPVKVNPTLADAEKLKMFTGVDYDFANYVEPGNGGWSYSVTFPSLTPGQGYLTRLHSPYNNLQYFGELNADVKLMVTSTGTNNGWNAVGNPFTSALDIKNDVSGFLTVNQDVFETNYGAVYIWSDPIGYMPITNAGYLTFSGSGILSDQYVQAGQGFLINVKSNGAGTYMRELIFKKGNGPGGMQAHSTGTSLKSKAFSWPGITLLATCNNKTRSTAVTFNEGMTTGLDQGYDAGILATSDFNFYTRLTESGSETSFAIQCLPDSEYESLVLPLGINLPEPGLVTFKSVNVILPDGLYPVIEDRLLQQSTPLKTENDSLAVSVIDPTQETGRFYLHMGGASTITGIKTQSEATKFTAWYYDHKITISGATTEGSRAILYDISGQKMSEEYRLTSSIQNEIPANGLSAGVYLINIEGKTGKQLIKVAVMQ